MPELPEVETVVRDLRRRKLAGRKIEAVRVYWPRTLANLAPRRFCMLASGSTVQAVERYGKFIILSLSNSRYLLIHLRMTGRLDLKPHAELRDPHEHVVLCLDGGQDLRFRDTRKFGRFYLVRDPAEVTGKLGPDPVRDPFSLEMFRERIVSRCRQIKPLLLDQSFLAGLGNIYVDEALWEAGLHPLKRSDRLKQTEIEKLHRAIGTVLEAGIRNLGTSIGKSAVNFYSLGGRWGQNQDSLNVFRRTGRPCPRCRSRIIRLTVAQRSTHICPQCQKLRQFLAEGGR